MQQASITTRDLQKLSESTDNIYYSIIIIGKRARQISIKTQKELKDKLNNFASTVDNLEEIQENREQTEISKFYEKKPKPPIVALEEFYDNKIHYNLTTLEKQP